MSTPQPPDPAAQGDPSEKRERILDAARSIMSEKGYDGTTVSEIVLRAGVAQGTFYLYFGSKADLPLAFAERIQTAMLDSIGQTIDPTLAPCDLFRQLLRTAYGVAEANRDILQLIGPTTLLAPDSDIANMRQQRVHPLIIDLLKRHQAQGGVAADLDPNVAVRLIDGIMKQLAMDVLIRKVDIPPERYLDQTLDFLCRALGARAVTD